MLFAKAILAGEPIKVFNHGQMKRDFTYVDDIVAGVLGTLDRPAEADPAFDRDHPDAASSWAPYRVFNIGSSSPVALMDFIVALESALGNKANLDMQPMQPGDVIATYAETNLIDDLTGQNPTYNIKDGLTRFAAWHTIYFKNTLTETQNT
jgi:UDP-glucuronate 4-epimerase